MWKQPSDGFPTQEVFFVWFTKNVEIAEVVIQSSQSIDMDVQIEKIGVHASTLKRLNGKI